MPLLNGENNKLLTTDKIAKATLATWQINLVLAKSVYRNLEKEFGEIGDTVSVRLPNNAFVNEGAVATKTTPLNDNTVALKIDKQKNIKFSWTLKDRRLSIVQFTERYLQPASNLLANHVDMSIAQAMRDAYFQFGTPGAALSYEDVTIGQAYAAGVAIPTDGLTRLITNTIDRANISNGISKVYNDALVKDAIQKGYAGELAGFETFFSQNLVMHETGSHTRNEQVAVDLQCGDTLDIKSTQAGAFKRGDRFTVGGVYEINPITKQRTGRLQVFTVVSDTPSSGATCTVTISPAINSGTCTAQDGMGNSIDTGMDQNVAGYPIVDAPITVIGDPDSIYRENYIMHRDAIALASVLMAPGPDAHPSTAHDPQTGLACTATTFFDGNNYVDNLRLDILFGVKLVRPDLIFRATCEKIA